MNQILNKTFSPKNRWRILQGGMGIELEPENSPNRRYRIAVGPLLKNVWGQEMYQEEMALDVFFFESNAPLKIKQKVRNLLVELGYSEWLEDQNLTAENLRFAKLMRKIDLNYPKSDTRRVLQDSISTIVARMIGGDKNEMPTWTRAFEKIIGNLSLENLRELEKLMEAALAGQLSRK